MTARNIALLNATYSSVPKVQLPISGGGTATFTEITDTTATASDVASGKYFYTSDGTLTAGTSSGGGGTSSWTKIAETSYTVSTSSTSTVLVATWSTGDSSLWTSDSFVYVRIRDTAGKRSGYFYGSDAFMVNYIPFNGASTSNITAGTYGQCYRYTTSNQLACRYTYGTTGYGVFADMLYSDGRIRIRSRYSSNYTLTVDGTYSVKAYLLTPPTGDPIFE